MDSLAYTILKEKLMSLKADNFQNAIDTLYGIIHETSYTPIKQKHDKGSDGFLVNGTALAIYAPERYQLADFKKKTKSDFEKYQENWQPSYPIWNVLTNLDNTGEMITHVKNLYSAAELISVGSICDLVRNQSWSKITRIFKALNLPESYLSFDVFTMIVDDISTLAKGNDSYSIPIYIKEKIEINIEDNESKDSFLDEYERYLVDFVTIQKVFGSFDGEKINALRYKVLTTYQMLSGEFLERIHRTTIILAGQRVYDDYYCFHIRKILVYLFEQCLIGRKTKSEDSNV